MKHLTTILMGILFFLSCSTAHSQNSCGQDHLHGQRLALDPEYESRLRANEKKIQKFIEEGAPRSVTGTYTLPIVVHVIYTSPTANNNISDDQIFSAVQRLNEQYSNADGNSTDTNIRFQLATMDENCQPTTGVLRADGSVLTNYVDHGIDIEYNDSDGVGADIKDVLELSRWNSDQYINLYIVNEINNNDGEYGVQGFSWVPGNSDPYDGIVLMYNALGYDYDNCNCFELKPYTELNTTFAHEMGHYLNLYHTFNGDSNGSACPSTDDNAGDYVADTPAHIRISSICPTGNNNCYASNHPFYDISTVGFNTMGYASAQCRYEFTAGQAERMVAAIETSRPGLIYSAGLQTTSVNLTEALCSPQTSTGISGEYGVGPILVKISEMYAASGTAYQDGGYLERPCFTANLEPNQTYDIEITTNGFYNEDIRVYADWDNSGGMGADELIFMGDNSNFFSGTFTVPADATTDEWLRLRVISDHESNNINSSCFAPQYGQVEDYPIFVQNNTPVITDDRGNALLLDGDGDYLTTNLNIDPSAEDFTLECWLNMDGSERGFQVIFDQTSDDRTHMFLVSAWKNKFTARFSGQWIDMDADAEFQYDIWHHIALSWDGTLFNFYLDGQLIGSSQIVAPEKNTQVLHLGTYDESNAFFKGQIDELRIWNTARTQLEIVQNMHLAADVKADAQVTYFQFNEDSGSTVSDYTSSASATLVGQATLATSGSNVGHDGEAASFSGVVSPAELSFNLCEFDMDLTALDGEGEFTVIYQKYPPNTTDGITAGYIYGDQTWTLHQTTGGDFSANFTFHFPGGGFTDLNAAAYQLYHRSSTSDGAWALLVDGASAVTTSSVTFDGVGETGQFLVVRE